MKLVTPTSNDPVKCSEFYRAILSVVNDLADFESEDCLKNPAIIAQLVRKLPPQARDKWWEVLYSINGKVIPDKDKPDTFMAFVKWQLNIADEMVAISGSQSKPNQKAVPKLSNFGARSNSNFGGNSVGEQRCKLCCDGSHPI